MHIYTTVSDTLECTIIPFVFLQLSQCQDRMLEMEKLLENPNDPDRVRYLQGKDLTPADMHSKLEEVHYIVDILTFLLSHRS